MSEKVKGHHLWRQQPGVVGSVGLVVALGVESIGEKVIGKLTSLREAVLLDFPRHGTQLSPGKGNYIPQVYCRQEQGK